MPPNSCVHEQLDRKLAEKRQTKILLFKLERGIRSKGDKLQKIVRDPDHIFQSFTNRMGLL